MNKDKTVELFVERLGLVESEAENDKPDIKLDNVPSKVESVKWLVRQLLGNYSYAEAIPANIKMFSSLLGGVLNEEEQDELLAACLSDIELGNLYLLQGDMKTAEQYFEKITYSTPKADPRHKAAVSNLGNILLRKGKWDEAEKHFLKMSEEFPKIEAAPYGLSIIYSKKKQKRKSMRFLKKALKINPSYIPAIYSLYQEKRSQKKKLKLLHSILQIDFRNLGAIRSLVYGIDNLDPTLEAYCKELLCKSLPDLIKSEDTTGNFSIAIENDTRKRPLTFSRRHNDDLH